MDRRYMLDNLTSIRHRANRDDLETRYCTTIRQALDMRLKKEWMKLDEKDGLLIARERNASTETIS